MIDDLYGAAQRWVNDDPDDETRQAGQQILDSQNQATIRAHFAQRLSFGTAGLRGEIGPGPNRMNRALVRRVTAAVGRHLVERVAAAQQRGIVVGYDGRHLSDLFAHDAVSILGGLGFQVYLFDRVIPTPRLAHAVRDLNASGGIMVTASHNPPQDNGYKVFWEDSAQIVPPHDVAISTQIDQITTISEFEFVDHESLRLRGQLRDVPSEVHAHYFDEISALRTYDGPASARIVYSAMHGVGDDSVRHALSSHGYHQVFSVPEQSAPDPDFPTVQFPNPEEPGAMDYAQALGREKRADVVLANDPDADRLCAALPNQSGGFDLLTGNEVGILMANELLASGRYTRDPLVVTTIVSTRLLSRLASQYGAQYFETLTGFKWIAHKAIQHAHQGGEFVMGFEEALGYSVGPVVRDKDGISAALIFADIVSRCKNEGHSVWHELEKIYRTHGYHCTAQRSFKYAGEAGRSQINAIMDRLRADPPAIIGGARVVRYRDLAVSKAWTSPDQLVETLELPPSNVLAYELESGSQILVRPSGTEPKIKFYFEIRERCEKEDTFDDFKRRGEEKLNALATQFIADLNL
ncbi:MAG: phospho-sugar mutase [Myxococcota bacterium]|nr:phospho-sugar mutase [Myxococcota bacterium]